MYNNRNNMQYRYDNGSMQANRTYCSMENTVRSNDCYVPSVFPDVTPIAMAFVPFQQSPDVYDEMKAFCQGTLFPDLDKPFVGCMR